MSLSTDWTMLYVLVYGLDHLYVLVHFSIRTQMKKIELLVLLLPLFRCAMGEEQDKKKPDEDDEKEGAEAASAKKDKKEKRSRSRRRTRSRRRRGTHGASEVSMGPPEGKASAPSVAEAASPVPAGGAPAAEADLTPPVAPKPKAKQPPSSSSEEEVELEPETRRSSSPPRRPEEPETRRPSSPRSRPPSPAAHPANRASTWCRTCWREVGGGASGYLAHVRSARHFQWSLYNSETRRGSRSWDELANEAQRLSNQAWEDAGEYNRRPMPRAEARAHSVPAGRERQLSVAPRRPYRRQLRSLPPPEGLAAMHSYTMVP